VDYIKRSAIYIAIIIFFDYTRKDLRFTETIDWQEDDKLILGDLFAWLEVVDD
jgi:hypothetical protein